MSTFTIPNGESEIRQINSGDLFGELNETFNIDLTTSRGKIKTSKRLSPVLVEGTDIGTPAGFVDMMVWDGNYYILTEDEVYSCSVSDDPTVAANWSEVTAIGDLDINSNAVIFDGQMRISLNTNIARYNGSASYANNWWTSDESGTSLNTGVPHVLEVVQSQKETIYVTDGSRVQYLEKGNTPKIVELDSNAVASCLAASLSGAMWVGSYNETSKNAYVYEIYTGQTLPDSTPVYQQAYPVNAQAVLAIWTKENIPYILTDKGEIQVFNGSGFATVAEFPFKYSGKAIDGIISGLIQDANRSRPIHPRGVRVHEDSVFLNLSTKAELTETDYPVDVRSHSGVWEYNHRTEVLNHRFSFAHQDSDYGDMVQDFAYPLLVVDNDYTFIMAGGYDDTNSKDNIYMTSDDTPQGWFITPEITSGTVSDVYEAVYHKAKTLADGEEIVTQYRTTKRDTIRGTLNWINATTCTTTDDWSEVQEGELIRIVSGKSAGNYANLVSITPSASTYTIVVDKEIGESGTSSKVYCDNFKRDAGVYTSEDGEVKRLGGYGTNPWIQFAVFLKGQIEYRQFISKGNSKNEL